MRVGEGGGGGGEGKEAGTPPEAMQAWPLEGALILPCGFPLFLFLYSAFFSFFSVV